MNATKKLKSTDCESYLSSLSTLSETLTANEENDAQQVSKTITPMGRKIFEKTMKE